MNSKVLRFIIPAIIGSQIGLFIGQNWKPPFVREWSRQWLMYNGRIPCDGRWYTNTPDGRVKEVPDPTLRAEKDE